MKIAICLYGNVGVHGHASGRPAKNLHELVTESSSAKKSIEPGYNGVKYILDNYDTDVFIHSWSHDKLNNILDIYKPKLYEIVKQKEFDIDPERYGIIGKDINKWKCNNVSKISYQMLINSQGLDWSLNWINTATFRSKSRWWSNKRAIDLKQKYEAANNFKYDFVLINRFDNIFSKRFDFTNLNKNLFFASQRTGREDIEYALYDYWFLCNSDDANIFGQLYDNVYDYSVSAVFAPRQHIESKIGKQKLSFLFKHDIDYRLLR